MFWLRSQTNPLESRRRLLVAESELNREQLIQEWVVMTGGVRTLTNRVKFYGPIASVAALLVSGLAAVRRGKVGSSYMQPSWLQMIPKGASLLLSLWPALRATSHDQDTQQPTSRR